MRGNLFAQFENGGMAWLRNQCKSEEPPQDDYLPARTFLKDWVEQAPKASTMLDLALEAFHQMPDVKTLVARQGILGPLSLTVWLDGVALPAIYKELTGTEFTIESDNQREVIESNETKFVCSARTLFGLSKVSADTVKRNWNRAKEQLAQCP